MARKKRAKPTRLQVALFRKGVAELVSSGTMLSIDPASGVSSLPGYAVFRAGERLESGTIAVGRASDELGARLWELGRSLREELAPPDGSAEWDVLVVEDIPDKNWSQAGKGKHRIGSAKNQKVLHRAVGAVLASVKAKVILFVHPSTWHAHVGPGYVKSDEGDALAMGEVAVVKARQLLAERAERDAKIRAGVGRKRPRGAA